MNVCGLSPRGRGNRGLRIPTWWSDRSIPAWAGQPQGASQPIRRSPVYPRVGGATVPDAGHGGDEGGLSPRGRGNRWAMAAPGAVGRSIPAWAGQPRKAASGMTMPGVYPRVGGATTAVGVHIDDQGGLSPRGRGNPLSSPCVTRGVYPRVGGATASIAVNVWKWMGLSPRGRGNPDQILSWDGSDRSIPAWAGQPPRGHWRKRRKRVYPRVGGATA